MTLNKKPRVSLIVAMAENRAIGKDGALPWDLPTDLKRFRDLTRGHVVVMGRKTYEAIVKARGGPLPNRVNIVITRNNDYLVPEGVVLCHSLEEALNEARSREKEEVFIIGGGKVFEEAIPLADRLYLTVIHKDFEGDAFFPAHEHVFTREIYREDHEENGIPFAFIDLERD